MHASPSGAGSDRSEEDARVVTASTMDVYLQGRMG